MFEKHGDCHVAPIETVDFSKISTAQATLIINTQYYLPEKLLATRFEAQINA